MSEIQEHTNRTISNFHNEKLCAIILKNIIYLLHYIILFTIYTIYISIPLSINLTRLTCGTETISSVTSGS